MVASAISFKSVGRTTRERQLAAEAERPVVPIGIKTPLRLGTTTTFEMSFDLLEQVRDNLRNLILTNWGERLGLFNFGGNLREMAAERYSREDYDQEVAKRIVVAIERWMPYVSLDELLPLDEDPQTRARILTLRRYLVTYSVPTVSTARQSLEISVGLT